jgi:prophage tail gpP-like protein
MSSLIVTVSQVGSDERVQLDGWKSARITRNIENCTGEFTLEMTERYPDEVDEAVLIAGVAIQISIADTGDVLITGFVDSVMYSVTPNQHGITVIGRGRCQDLIDCTGRVDRIMSNMRIDAVCQMLTEDFGINVNMSDAMQAQIDALPTIPFQLVALTEKVWEVIERCARYSGVLAYEDVDGNLTLAVAGDTLGVSGVAQGENIEAAYVLKSALGRYSALSAFLSNYNNATDVGVNLTPGFTDGDPQIKALGRHRPLAVLSEQPSSDRSYLQKRVLWQVARAYGQSRQIRVLTDSWLDGGNEPWKLNVQIPVSIPKLKVPENTPLLVTEVTFILDEHGTHTELRLAPREGYLPEPLALQRIDPDLAV